MFLNSRYFTYFHLNFFITFTPWLESNSGTLHKHNEQAQTSHFVIQALYISQTEPCFQVEHKTDCLCIHFEGGHFAIGAPLQNSREGTVPECPPFRHLCLDHPTVSAFTNNACKILQPDLMFPHSQNNSYRFNKKILKYN